MATRKAQEIPTPLENTRQRLERWRQTSPAKSRIPETLWNAAAKMAERYGVARTAGVLRLDYYRLKRRLDQKAAQGAEASPAAARTTFLQLPAPGPPLPVLPAADPPASVPPATAECVVELEDATGAKMRIHLKGAQTFDLAALSRSFWSAER
jgi:hypothetical protein